MSVKATENCVKNLIAKGIHGSKIALLTSMVVLDTVHLQSPRVDCACQVDVSSSCSKNWFESVLECIDITETELEIISTATEDDNLLFDPIDCTVLCRPLTPYILIGLNVPY